MNIKPIYTVINFGGKDRNFLFSIGINRAFSKRSPLDAFRSLELNPVKAIMDLGYLSLTEAENKDLPSDFTVENYEIWWDNAPLTIKQKIRIGIRKVMDVGAQQEDIIVQFENLVEQMTKQEKVQAKKILVDGLPKNETGERKKVKT